MSTYTTSSVKGPLPTGSNAVSGNSNVYLLASLVRERCGHSAIPVAVCWPLSGVALAGAVEAAEMGLIVPMLVGPAHQIERLALELGLNIKPYTIVEAGDEEEAAAKS